MSSSRRENNAFSTFREFVERFELLVGVSSLGVATAILALANRTRTRSRNADPSLGLILMVLTGALSFVLNGYVSKDGLEGRQQISRKEVRAG